MATVMLLVIGIVGTTVAPWQLFFQQSYVIDKRITPRFMKYEKADLWIGIVIVVVGAAALMGVTAAAFAGHPGRGQLHRRGRARARHRRPTRATSPGWCSRSRCSTPRSSARSRSRSPAPTRSATCSGMNHSLHRGVRAGEGVLRGLRRRWSAAPPTIVLIPGSPLGLITEGVQVLAGRAAAERDALPAAALQRQGRARPVGERAHAPTCSPRA